MNQRTMVMKEMLRFKNFIQSVELKLILFLLSLFFFISILILVMIKDNYISLIIPVIILFIIILFVIFDFIEDKKIRNFLKKFKQNIPDEVVVILGRNNFFKLEGWLKASFPTNDQIILLIELLKKSKKGFSFYLDVSIEEAEKIMRNSDIKEIYLLGHGDSVTFELGTDITLHYHKFDDFEKYKKDLVHQLHCGNPDGKNLIDYVVPEENKKECIFFRKKIHSFDVGKELKRKISNFLIEK